MEQPLKILMLNHEFPPVGGGASPVTFELCKQLVKMGHKVDVVTMHYGHTSRFETVDGMNIYRTPAIRKRPNICYTHELATYVPGAFFKTLRLARKERYDIIHCHFVVPGAPLAWLVSKLTGIPFIITCHGTDVPGHNPDRFGIVHRLVRPAWRFLARSSALLTSPSQSLKSLILENCPDLDVCIVPNGIYAERFTPTEKNKSILMCSRLFEFKGFQYALEAIKQMEIDWEVNIIGEGPFRGELERIAQLSKTPVRFWGWIDKSEQRFYELFSRSSIFIFPSEAESFGMVIAEAMAAGNAIIASDIPAHREVLGDSGVYVPVRRADRIREEIHKLIENAAWRQSLQRKTRERILQNFSWDSVGRQFLGCYEKVLNR
ncbi:MAG: glycosyltransferase family 4 protein [Planctomycetota bacterium]